MGRGRKVAAMRGSAWRDVDRARVAAALILIGAVFSFGLGQALGHIRSAPVAHPHVTAARAHTAGGSSALHVDLQAAPATSAAHTLPNAAPAPRTAPVKLATHAVSHSDGAHHAHHKDGHHGGKHGGDQGGDAAHRAPKVGGSTQNGSTSQGGD
jgi:hypothetical protein